MVSEGENKPSKSNAIRIFLALGLSASLILSLLLSVSCSETNNTNEAEYVSDQIIVKFKPGTPSEAEEQLNQSLGTTVIYTSPSAGFKVLQIPEGKTVAEMVKAYSKQSIVEYAEPNYIDRAVPQAR